jgi:hypothetical protein
VSVFLHDSYHSLAYLSYFRTSTWILDTVSTTVSVMVAATVYILSGSVTPIEHCMLTIPSIVLANAMACRVFRSVRNNSGELSGNSGDLSLQTVASDV